MQDEDEARLAISDLNGYQFDGVSIKVEVSGWSSKIFFS